MGSPGVGGTISAASDVSFSSPAEGQVIKRSGNYWVNGTAAGAGNAPGYNVVAHVTVAAANATAEQKAVADYVCDGTNDEVEINQAITTVSNLYGTMGYTAGNAGVVQLVGTNFMIGHGRTNNAGSIKLRRNTVLRGSGMYQTWIHAAPSFVTYSPSLTPDANPVGGAGTTISNGAAGMIELFDNDVQFAFVEDLFLHGRAGNGARVMGLKYEWTNGGANRVLHSDTGCQAYRVMIQSPASHGVATLGGGSGAPNRASQWQDIRVMDPGTTVDANASGYWTSGADHVWMRCTVGSAASHGWVISGSNNHFTDCTSWFGGSLASTSNGGTSSANGCGFWVSGGRHVFLGSTSQDNFGHGFMIRSGYNVFSSVISDSNGWSRQAGVSTGSGFFMYGDGNVITGTAFDKSESGRGVFMDYGIRFASSTHKGNIIHLVVNNCRLDSIGGSIPHTNNSITIMDQGNTYDGGVSGRSIQWSGGTQIQTVKNTAPVDADIQLSQMQIWHDDASNMLRARVRKSDGSYRTVDLG